MNEAARFWLIIKQQYVENNAALRFTYFPVLGHVAAAVIQVSEATVPCQGVHDPCCTDGMYE